MRASSSIRRMRSGSVTVFSRAHHSRNGSRCNGFACAGPIQWDGKREYRAFLWRCSHFNRTAVAFEYLVHDRQPQARALADLLGGKEGVENLRQDVVRNAATRIGEADLGSVVDDLAVDRQGAFAVD